MIFRRNKLSAIILALLFRASLMSGTTIVIFITPAGIVIATDSKAVNTDPALSSQSETTVQKFVIVHDKIVVATTGLSAIGGVASYQFAPWMNALQSKLPADASVEDVAWAIKEESKTVFAPLQDAIRRGYLTKNAPDKTCESYITYLVAGYQDSTATIWEVQYYIDWNTQTLVGPNRIQIEPQKQPTGKQNIFLHSYGVDEVIRQLGNTESYAYKQTMARVPKAVADFSSGKSYVSLDETAAIARVLVQIEKQMDPSDVGGEVRIVQLPANGKAEEIKSSTVASHVRKPRSKPHHAPDGGHGD